MYVIITRWEANNRGVKHIRGFNDNQAAVDHMATIINVWPDSFVDEEPSANSDDWLVDPNAKTLSYAPLPVVNDPMISFDDFEGRFTNTEWDDATDFVYEVNTTSGKPKRRALVQGLARVQARNSIDLLDPKTDTFLSILVSGGVIDEQRKIAILTP